jgi:hypothetical protein
MIQKTVNVDFLQRGTLLVLSSPKLIDTVMGCYLRKPRAERHDLIFLVQHSIKFQENFSSGILSVRDLTKKLSAGLQDVGIVSNV